MKRDAFPTTLHTWIGRKLGEGDAGRAEINHHVMSVYAWPLTVYFQGTRDRWVGEPEEVVQGFFADRLARPRFFDDWHRSGLRLRRWLINAFCFYLSEMRRRRKRDLADSEMSVEPEAFDGNPELAVDRAFVVAVVRQALHQARQACAEQGLEEHWRIFIRHHYQGVAYHGLAPEFGVEPARAAVMARTATRKFRNVIRDLMLQDGASQEGIDDEIRSLLEVAGA